MSKKVLITVGGTGGHVFPAIALGKQLLNSDETIKLHFTGGNLASNPYFERESFDHSTVACATFKSKNPWSALKTVGKITWGIAQSSKVINKFNPDLVVGFGSYYTLPMLVAAKLKKVPFVLHEANSIPGKVNKLLAKYARVTGIHFPETADLLQGNTFEVGLPLRPGYQKGSCTAKQAREYFHLDPNRFTVLIFGGSQGALKLNKMVNEAFCHDLPELKSSWQILHFAGDAVIAQLLREDYQKAGVKACVKPFETRMDLAWQAADFCISRAGAGTIAEQLEFEVPGILIPFPFATDNHQEKNADFLVKKVKGAVKLLEAQLTAENLAHAVKSYHAELREKSVLAMKNYKLEHRPKDFCTLILEELKEV
jgi:UDP-N-acetylglucosamine--N-acetylmuramyl-(pentapeptide) pyrophosphoryl-undecaprenol N-acetylglucosamine transferase